MIAVMCNPGLKARHWDHMSDIAKFDLMPDSSATLRKMLLLNILPYMEQFEAISASATKVSVVGFVNNYASRFYTNAYTQYFTVFYI